MRSRYRLSATQTANAKEPGKLQDGGGLILHVRDGGSRQWVLRFQRHGRKRTMGLGGALDLTLADARARADEARRLIAAGHDPIEHRKAARQAEAATAARLTTMRDLAALYLAKHDGRWTNDKHRREWRSSLDRLVLPIIGNMAASDVETAHVLKVLEPIWTRIPETADRVRGRVQSLLDFARVAGLRGDGDNPAKWDGHLAALLPAPKALKPTTHHPALAYADVPNFVVALRTETSVEARALEVIVLTAVRLSEAIFARWAEIDFATKCWTVPAERMKRRKAHVVPLSDRVLAIFAEMRRLRDDPADTDFVFPGRFADKPISDNSIDRLRVRLTDGRATTHGFRAAFRTWAAERTSFPEAVCEQALAHAVKGSVIRAYQRSSLLDQRKRLMAQWAAHCSAPVATGRTVVALRGARHG